MAIDALGSDSKTMNTETVSGESNTKIKTTTDDYRVHPRMNASTPAGINKFEKDTIINASDAHEMPAINESKKEKANRVLEKYKNN